MKHTFNTPELRQTASGIKTAVAPKSVTPEMVGGTLLDLVDAQGEIIEALAELGREKVTVRVNAYDGSQRVSTTNAKVYVDIFSVGGIPTVALPRQELAVDENGEVTFEVYKGYKYALFSKLDGMGASFQFTYTAGQDERTIDLWNLPLGVYPFGLIAYCNEATNAYRCSPFITEDGYDPDYYENIDTEWDLRDDEYQEESYYLGIMVSTENTAFAIEVNNKSAEYLQWSNTRYFAQGVPTLPQIYENPADFDGDYDAAWDDAVARAREDWDGNLNTEKILSFCKVAPAADFCSNIGGYERRQVFLPSAGQLYLMYLNKAAINALMTAFNDDGYEFVLLDNTWYWSSTQHNEFCAWGVDMYYGYTYGSNKDGNYYVRAVSAFHFIY